MDSLNPYPSLNNLNIGNDPSRKYSIDFSEKFEKSKDKLIYSVVFLLIVSLFVVDPKTGFFGIKLENLTDRGLEWMAWLAACFFAANTCLRYLDERRETENYLKEISYLDGAFKVALKSIERTNSNCLEALGENKQIKKDLAIIQEQLNKVQAFPVPERTEAELADFLKKYIGYIRSDINSILQSYEWSVGQIKELPKKIDHFEKRVKRTKQYRNFSGFRFVVFDVFLPASLFLFASFLHFFPSAKLFILNLIPA